MIKWIILILLVAISTIVFGLSYENTTKHAKPEKISAIEMGQEFLNKTAINNSVEKRILGELREITEQEILKEAEIPDMEENEQILYNGIKLSADYNQVSYEYSSEKISDVEYLAKLFDYKIKYEKYMTAVDSYIGEKDILIQRNSMIQELEEIKKQITLLRNSQNMTEWEIKTEYEKYKKYLPSMFVP